MKIKFGFLGSLIVSCTMLCSCAVIKEMTTDYSLVNVESATDQELVDVSDENTITREKQYIPEGCTYTIAATGEVLSEGQAFPDVPQKGDEYITTDYRYCYKEVIVLAEDNQIEFEKWHVSVLDSYKTTYEPLLSYICYEPVRSIYHTFEYCYNMTEAPEIPSTVVDMRSAFSCCTKLVNAPKIPEGVTDMMWTFSNCIAMETAPNIPNSVTCLDYTFETYVSLKEAPEIPYGITSLSSTFSFCKSIVESPKIPSSVTYMHSTFMGCESLTKAPAIPSGVTSLNSTFAYCKSLEVAPEIPDTVTNMSATFAFCENLVKAPEIPSDVIWLTLTFKECINLTGTITINANPNYYSDCFADVDLDEQNITLLGESSMLEEIKNTAD